MRPTPIFGLSILRNPRTTDGMAARLTACALLTIMPALAAKKVISPTTSGSNELVDIVATLVMDQDEVKQKLGADPGAGVVLLEVRVTPKTDKSVQVSPDDFIILAHDDGERSRPFEPEELAGKGAMVLTNSTASPKKTGQTFGLGGMMAGGGGSPGNPKVTTTSTKMDEKRTGNEGLVQALKAKELPQKDTTDEVSGYLYFPLTGKHKLKNMALLYRGPAGKLNLEFVH
ncbi:MAG TPA: hypothetical protein VHZ55_22865 [Bryobacteraceae bacterium]|nr:hypothetical protein [Bryobacteraceae bacterium]